MIERRTLLQALLALVGARPAGARVPVSWPWQTAAPPAAMGDREIAALRGIADVALPSALGESGRSAAVDRFVRWHRNYREAADRGHSYGASTLSQPSGPPPSARYAAQFAALDAQAQSRGAASFAALAPLDRRSIVEAALNEPTRITNLPARPTGANLVADLLGYFFNGAEAFDLAYDAAIGRDSCRGLDGSDQPPARLGRG